MLKYHGQWWPGSSSVSAEQKNCGRNRRPGEPSAGYAVDGVPSRSSYYSSIGIAQHAANSGVVVIAFCIPPSVV